MPTRDGVKEQCINICERFKFKKLILTHGAAMYMAGVTERLHNVDGVVSEREFDKLRKTYPTVQLTRDIEFVSVTQTINIFRNPIVSAEEDETVHVVGNVYYRNLNATIRDYEAIGRRIDMVKVEMIRNHIASALAEKQLTEVVKTQKERWNELLDELQLPITSTR